MLHRNILRSIIQRGNFQRALPRLLQKLLVVAGIDTGLPDDLETIKDPANSRQN
jgi:hypothetical protein